MNNIITFIITGKKNDFASHLHSMNNLKKYGNTILLHDADELKNLLLKFAPNDQFRLLVHGDEIDNERFVGIEYVSNLKDFLKIDKFHIVSRNNDIKHIEYYKDYPDLVRHDFKKVNSKDFVDGLPVYIISEVMKTETFNDEDFSIGKNNNIAILNALYNDEFEQVKEVFNLSSLGLGGLNVHHVETDKYNIYAAFQNSSGNNDASAISTRLIKDYKPKYIFMTGVCGSPELPFGSIVISKFIFNIGKGKYKNGEFFKELEVCKMSPRLLQKIQPLTEKVLDKVKSTLISHPIYKVLYSSFIIQDLKAVIEPTACSNTVIADEDYYKTVIENIDRKTASVEMEGFGVMTATELNDEYNTKAIIIKAVMDHADGTKNDEAKKFASLTSALFLKYLLEEL